MLMVSDDIEVTGTALCWDLIKRGVLTHDALPERTYESLTSRFDVVQEMSEAYGYTDERPPKFRPTPRDVSNMLPVWYWLNDLRHQIGTGRRDFKLLVMRARGAPWWKLESKFGRCEKTVKGYYRGAVCWVYLANRDEVFKLAA